MSNTQTAARCTCGADLTAHATQCPRAWFARRRATTDAAVVVYLNDVEAPLPHANGTSGRRMTLAELNAYGAEAVAAGRIVEIPGDPYTWRLASNAEAVAR